MDYRIIKLNFSTPVRFGSGGLTRGEYIIHADTIFSALCIEILRINKIKLETLIEWTKEGKLLISDALPFIHEKYYIPKPIMDLEIQTEGDSVLKKASKKLEYICIEQVAEYLDGKLDILTENEFFSENIGKYTLIQKARIPHQEEAKPYSVSVFQFNPGSGIYFCIGFETQEQLDCLEETIRSLSYTGIGGKVSSGFGKFKFSIETLSDTFLNRLQPKQWNKYETLSVCLPKNDEIQDVLTDSQYLLLKRGGFISSSEYSPGYHKKRELYVFAAGSTFSGKFDGDVYDVSVKGKHPVYRYAKPMLLGVK